MCKLIDLKLSYQKKNTQFILIDNEGFIKESDYVLFDVCIASQISNVHPFFFSIDLNLDNHFTCVHLNIDNIELICDIEIKQVNDNKALIIISDFSEHYNSFQSLAQSRNESAISSELVHLNNQLLIEKENFKNKFITNFSHEVISPIMSIMTFANVLSKTKVTKEQHDCIDVINNSAYHLKDMVNDVLDLSKIETNNLEINNKRFSLKKLINTIETEYQRRAAKKGLVFNCVYNQNMPNYIVSDKKRIYQVIKNLLDNAIKFTDTGYVSIKITKVYRRARHITFSICVEDSGRGIDQPNQDLIFERFTRLNNTNQSQGTGLGLTIVKELVTLLSGDIVVESELNKGTTFTLHIKSTTPLKDINQKKIREEKQNYLSHHKVLIVDNNITDQTSIFKILANNKGFFLDIANSGQEAIQLVKTNNYDLVLMDYNMPNFNGIKTSKALKKLNKKLPIILITGSYINLELHKYKDKYYEFILNKPFDEETLINSIYMYLK